MLFCSLHQRSRQVPQQSRDERCAILRNIGQTSARLGQFLDAAQAFETVLANTPDHTTALQLVVCSYALGDVDKMRRVFVSMLTLPLMRGVDDEGADDMDEEGGIEEGSWGSMDPLKEELRQRKQHAEG